MNIRNKDRKLKNLRGLQIQTYQSPHHQPHFFFPAGSLSSRHNSQLDSQEEFNFRITPGSRTQNFQQGQFFPVIAENIIKYVPILPNQASPIFTQQQYVQSTPESEDFPELEKDLYYQQELQRIQHLIENSTNDLIIQYQKIAKIQQSTMTDQNFTQEIDRLKQINLQLKSDCQAYSQQNFQLRKELQASVNDFLVNEENLKDAQKKLKGLEEKLSGIHLELSNVVQLLDQISEEESVVGKQNSQNHVFRYIGSKLDILKSRIHRMKIRNEFLSAQNEKLKRENQENEFQNLLGQLKREIRQKDSLILSLQRQISELKRDFNSEASLQSTLNASSYFQTNKRELQDSSLGLVRNSVLSLEGQEFGSTGEHINYKEVLKDLREITSRASKALEQSNQNRYKAPTISLKPLQNSRGREFEELRKKYGTEY